MTDISLRQRDEERRRRKERERRDRDREREREREEKELRRARDRDERGGNRSRRPSISGGYPTGYPTPGYGSATAELERRLQDMELDRARDRDRDREYDRERKVSTGMGRLSRRGSFYGSERPTSGYQPAPGGPQQYPSPPSAYPTPAPSGYGSSPATSYATPGYRDQYGRQSTYAPPSPRPGESMAVPRPVSPFLPGAGPRPVSPYQNPGMMRPVSPYQAGAIPRPVSPYQNPAMGMARPVSPYQAGMQRAASPRPGMDMYPRGHIMEGQPMRRPISRAASPVPGVNPYGAPSAGYGSMNSSAGYGASTGYSGVNSAYGSTPGYGASGGYSAQGMPGGTSPRMPMAPGDQSQQMLSAPEGFSRPPNLAQPYTHFEMMKIQDMDDFLEVIPRMPLVLVPHDVYHEDWIRFMNVNSSWNVSAWIVIDDASRISPCPGPDACPSLSTPQTAALRSAQL